MAQALDTDLLIIKYNGAPIKLPKQDALGTVRIGLLPTRESEDAARLLVRDLDAAQIGLALNGFEVLSDGSRPARLRDFDGTKVFHVALWDGPVQAMLPGQGTLNLGGLARVLARAGFDGVWSVGVSPQGVDTVLNAYRSLVTVLSDAAMTEPLLRHATPDLPQKVAIKGFEFIEFGVDASGALQLEAMLGAMAFRKERKHLSKNVTLWRQGAVNIVINQDGAGHAGQAVKDHGPCVCDMGLRVQNAQETVARARALGTKDFTQSVRLGELDIPAVHGVGGSILHLIDEQSDLHRVWDIEFEPVTRTKATPPAGLRRIDHVAQTMRYDEMQSWLLYYLSTFVMAKSPIVNVADPSGIVRSQVIETPEGEVRLNLNGAADAQTFAGSFVLGKPGAGVQHIAFQSDDILETSTQLETAGFARLKIPSNYYAETQAVFDLDDATTDMLKVHNILYDHDENGAYFQLYGQAIFDGFFFEIVQRQGGYAGYGARNAPIRLSAQTSQS
jgi:4-hydroxyphenylpyruvate dioxygenase